MTAKTHDTFDAPAQVNRLLADAAGRAASDLHLEPVADGYEIRLRVDGLLETGGRFGTEAGGAMVSRLMVMAGLLTYRRDVPQEGRLVAAIESLGKTLELRVAVMPTALGLRCAVRLPAELSQPRRLEDLSLPPRVLEALRRFAAADSGMLIVCGPAGSGKTTTLYALLEFIAARHGGQSLISLEDPVERHIPGVTQIEVSPFGQLTMERALRSILRQDPQVLMLGEIRDAATASLAIQAALSGHRLLCTLHAASAGGAMTRLLEMGLEPYQITSTLYGVLNQRLLRRREGEGYHGRVPVAEWAAMDEPLRRAVLERADAAALARLIEGQAGYESLANAARRLMEAGVTDAAEVERVLGAAADQRG